MFSPGQASDFFKFMFSLIVLKTLLDSEAVHFMETFEDLLSDPYSCKKKVRRGEDHIRYYFSVGKERKENKLRMSSPIVDSNVFIKFFNSCF